LTVSGQDGRTSYRTSTPGRGSIFNIEKIDNFQKIENNVDGHSDDMIGTKNEKRGNFSENVGFTSEISNFRIKSLLSIKNTDLTSYSPYLCVRCDGQLSFENILNKDDANSFTFYLKIIPEFSTNNSNNYNNNTTNINRIEKLENRNVNVGNMIIFNNDMNSNNKNHNDSNNHHISNNNYSFEKKQFEIPNNSKYDENYKNLKNSISSKINEKLTEGDLSQFYVEGYLKIAGAVDQYAISSCLR
jgi:hypothetical protein